MFPDRQTGLEFAKRTTMIGKVIPFAGNPVFEAKSYVLDEYGGHVTFRREEGTFDVFGGGRIEDIKFPYPDPMFEVIDEAEATRIKAQWRAAAASQLERHRWKWLDWFRFGTARLAQA